MVWRTWPSARDFKREQNRTERRSPSGYARQHVGWTRTEQYLGFMDDARDDLARWLDSIYEPSILANQQRAVLDVACLTSLT